MSVATPPLRGRQRPWPRLLAALALAALAGGCASLGTGRAPEPELAYVVDGADRIARHAPVFVHEHDTEAYNRIGRPRAARDADGGERVFVDPAEPVVFVEQRSFTSTGGVRYTNLFYRVHFERVPVSLAPFHVTAGRNGGLFVIATLDADEQPVLYTTVHTCGCYLAFLPTSLLPAAAYPEDWPEDGQNVFGERLPSRVAFTNPRTADDQRLVVRLRDGTHRIMDAEIAALDAVRARYRVVTPAREPVAALRRLPLADGGTTSFFYEDGRRSGYVRDITKPFELMLISWWAFDLNVGVDKDYGAPEDTATVFYTSLKPWRRTASDMEHFARFLDYWGWRL